jgi:hypothetical protein
MGYFALPPILWRRSPNQSQRTSAVDLVVVHDTEGSYAGSVSWLCNPHAQASAHVVLREDGGEATQLVGWNSKAWACASFNSRSDNLEIAGSSRKGYPDKQLRRAARIVAYRLHKRGLKPRHVKPLSGQTGGFCYHSDLGAPGGGHTDPGFSKARSLWFDAWVKFEYARGHFRASWGRD